MKVNGKWLHGLDEGKQVLYFGFNIYLDKSIPRTESTWSMENVQKNTERISSVKKNIPINWKELQRNLSPKSSEHNKLFRKFLQHFNFKS